VGTERTLVRHGATDPITERFFMVGSSKIELQEKQVSKLLIVRLVRSRRNVEIASIDSPGHWGKEGGLFLVGETTKRSSEVF